MTHAYREPRSASACRGLNVAFELPLGRTDSAGAANRNGKGPDDADPELEPVGEFERTSARGMVKRGSVFFTQRGSSQGVGLSRRLPGCNGLSRGDDTLRARRRRGSIWQPPRSSTT